MRKIEATHRCCRQHRAAVGQSQSLPSRIEHLEQLELLAVIRTGGVAVRRTNAAILLRNQLLIRQALAVAVSPVLARLRMEVLRERFGQSIGECLDHDRVVIVEIPFELPYQIVGAKTGRYCKHAKVVRNTALARGDEVRQRSIWTGVGNDLLLSQ